MNHSRLNAVLRQLRHYLATERVGGTADGELLRRFTTTHDETAFAALVQRYGPLVLGVCRRVLSREHDAEDAFQATFLILIRRAASLDGRGSLANWLYTVAYHAALKARAGAARRPTEPVPLDTLPAPDSTDDLGRRELCAVLDEELQGLPAKYREPLLLCDLQGKTHQEVARVLGRPPGSVSRLLERARSLLRDRLAQRGLALSAGLLIASLTENARAVTPSALTHTTLQAVAAGPVSSHVLTLVEGVIRQMFLTRIKIAAALLLTLGLLGAGAGLLTAQAGPKDRPSSPAAEAQPQSGDKATDEARYEAPLPAGALARLGTSRFRHAFTLRGLAISPDGKIIASGSNKGTIRLWEADTGRELRVITGHTSAVVAFAFSADGKTLASASWDKTARLWDVASGKALRTFAGHEQGVHSVAFSPDGKTLLTASGDKTARLWEVATGTQLSALEGHEDVVTSAVFSHDGKSIATSSVDKTIRLWDPATAKELRKLEGHGNRVVGVAFSPDDKRLASGSWDCNVRLWEVSSGKTLTFLKHVSGVEKVVFSPDGKSVAATEGWSDEVRVWDVTGENGRVRWKGKVGQPFAVAFSGDGKKVVASGWDSKVHVWDAATGEETAASRGSGHTGWVNGMSFLPDRKTLISAANDSKVIFWDTSRGRELRHLDGPGKRAWCLAVAPDGKTFATGCHDQGVALWDVRTGKVTSTIKVEGSVRGVAFSPDGRRLAVVTDENMNDGSIKPVTGNGAGVWDLATGNLLFRLEGHESGVRAVAFSPDGKFIATGGADKLGRLWDATTGKELRKFEGHSAPVEAVAFSPDSKVAATAGQGGTVFLWHLGTDEPALPLNTRNGGLEAIVFSPDGRTIATANHNTPQVKAAVRLWDVRTGKERARFPGHQETASALAFSPDGRVLATGGGDGTVLLWDLTGRVENGKFATVELPQPSLEGEWTDLVGDDGFKIHKAIWTLAAAPKQTLPLLRETLKPVQAPDAKRIAQLVKDLDNADFEAREKASAELDRIGEPAAGALRKALEGSPSAEMRLRINHLLDKFGGKAASPDVVRRERALEVLEHVGGPDARALLEELAKGAPEGSLTQEAKAALQRLGK